MELKPYQTEALDTLRRFLEEARIAGPAAAYAKLIAEPELAARLGRRAATYRPLAGLPATPHVCLRLPTGGGKTLLAAHAVAVARRAWIERDHPLVLWLAPTSIIRRQTAEALKNPRHPCRRALDAAFAGRVRVFDIADFAQLRPHDLRDKCCVVVGTIQTLRVENTEGRKVYAHHEDMEAHFAALPAAAAAAPGLERLPEGGAKFSFANLLHLHRPLMIVDEAQNAVTGLTREMQARVNPCAVIEFTATPRKGSNVLFNARASELKREAMIKLPVALAEHDDWRGAVSAAVAERARLAETAKADPGYVRPVALFQAQPKNREVTAEALKRHLIEVERVPAERIAVATGDQRELDGVDLFDPACPVEHVVTVQALKEGWDCSFAYVFCSVSRIRSAADVEQLLGRVLRMPYAERRAHAALNKAYAFVHEPDFAAAAKDLSDRLVAMGFEEDEAKENVEPAQPELDPNRGLFAARDRPQPVFRHAVALPPEAAAALEGALPEGAAARATDDGAVEIAVDGWVGDAREKAILDALPPAAQAGFAEAAARFRHEEEHRFPPSARGVRFEVPALVAMEQGELELADTDLFMESHDWSLAAHPYRPDASEFSIRETARGFEIDVRGDRDGDRVTYAQTGAEAQFMLDVDVEGWTSQNLTLWLDREVRADDVDQSDLIAWLSGLLSHLTAARGLSVAALTLAKFQLARKVRDRIAAIRRREREAVYQRRLFAPETRPQVSFGCAFAFRDGMYADERRYRGRWRPNRHFLGPDAVPAFDGDDDGEEVRCAQALDSLPGVKHWIRNVARHPESFRLPTASDWFYPDFAAELDDGRLLVVEYKGAHLADGADAAEKSAVGELWERASQGRGLFLVVEKEIDGKDPRAQLTEKLERPERARNIEPAS